MSLKTSLFPTAATALLAVPLVSGAANAHVSLERSEAARGTSYKAVLKIPHGCDGASTHTVRVEIPEGFISVKPMPKPGWKIDTVSGPYAKTYAFYHGKSLKEGVKEIQWSGGDLPDAYYDEFVASGFVAKDVHVVSESAQGVSVAGPFKAGDEVAVAGTSALKAAWLGESGAEEE